MPGNVESPVEDLGILARAGEWSYVCESLLSMPITENPELLWASIPQPGPALRGAVDSFAPCDVLSSSLFLSDPQADGSLPRDSHRSTSRVVRISARGAYRFVECEDEYPDGGSLGAPPEK
jgi:hypothetical protein